VLWLRRGQVVVVDGDPRPGLARRLRLGDGQQLTVTRAGAIADATPKLLNPKIGPELQGWQFPPYGDLSEGMTITIGGPF
jgi:hypothetical protein